MVLQRRHWVLLCVLILVSMALGVREMKLQADGHLHIRFLSVGQGDSALITTPSGKTVVIDGGPDWSTLEHLGKKLPFFDRSIDMLLLSHPNLDHLAAFPEVMKRFQIGVLATTEIDNALPKYNQMFVLAKEQETKLLRLSAGQTIDLGDGVILTILWPPSVMPPGFTKDSNNTSSVVRLDYNNHRALFTGDMERTAEMTLVTARADLRADVLKIGHHGSTTSTSMEFLHAVHPSLAVISVGDNSYGHPRAEILDRLKKFGAEVRRTDEDGTVEVTW